jgi:toxin ParE1/3/4
MKSSIRIIIQPSAEVDIREIMRYTEATWGRGQRNAYFSELRRAARQLLVFPEMGREVDDGIRELVLRHHIVLYRYDDDIVTVLRVLNPRQLRR